WGSLKESNGERLRTLAPIRDGELHACSWAGILDSAGQRGGVQENVAAVVVGDETEAAARIIEPNLAGGHDSSLADSDEYRCQDTGRRRECAKRSERRRMGHRLRRGRLNAPSPP